MKERQSTNWLRNSTLIEKQYPHGLSRLRSQCATNRQPPPPEPSCVSQTRLPCCYAPFSHPDRRLHPKSQPSSGTVGCGCFRPAKSGHQRGCFRPAFTDPVAASRRPFSRPVPSTHHGIAPAMASLSCSILTSKA